MSSLYAAGRTYEFGIGDRLRAAREQAGFTVRDFEEVTGISRSTIGNYENGKTKPRRASLLTWALATGFDLNWLQHGVSGEQDGPDGGMAARHARTDV